MNNFDCQAVRSQFDEWLDGDLDRVASQAMESHVHGCEACAGLLHRDKLLRTALRNMPTPPPRPGFAAEALKMARMADRTELKKAPTSSSGPAGAWMMAFSGAALATSCIAIALWVTQPGGRLPGQGPAVPGDAVLADRSAQLLAARQPLNQPAAQTVSLSVGRVESMRLRIDAPRDLSEVHFSVDLPENVELAGQPGIRAITWKGQLLKGENVLELPLLVAKAGASGVLAARVNWGQFERRIETSIVGVNRSEDGKSPGSGI